jgi:hypothetical protein
MSARYPSRDRDILGITTTERRRWLADGKLPSAGTRTIKLRGRGTITFHVFDPKLVQAILDEDVIHLWREEHLVKTAENKRLAAWGAHGQRERRLHKVTGESDPEDERFKLIGWAEFERDGPL